MVVVTVHMDTLAQLVQKTCIHSEYDICFIDTGMSLHSLYALFVIFLQMSSAAASSLVLVKKTSITPGDVTFL
jgi:predicted exporter